MGVFRCVECQCTYHSKRFFWEDDPDETDIDAVNQDNQIPCPGTCPPDDNKCNKICHTELPQGTHSKFEWQGALVPVRSDSALLGVSAMSHQSPGVPIEWTTGSLPRTASDKQQINLDPGWYHQDGIACPSEAQFRTASDLAQFLPSADVELATTEQVGNSNDDHEDAASDLSMSEESSNQQIAVRGDVVRATGTAANILGSAAPVLGHALAPFSFVGGAVGAASGAAQLQQGLYTQSGLVDPHLVTKGAVTTGVGTTCMALGAGAFLAPGLFIAALVLGVAGLGTATAIDANMDGLCEHCREHGHCDSEDQFDVSSTDADGSDSSCQCSSDDVDV